MSQVILPLPELRAVAVDGRTVMDHPKILQKNITAPALRKLCDMVSAPVEFMMMLPPTLKCQILNYMLRNRAEECKVQLTINEESVTDITTDVDFNRGDL